MSDQLARRPADPSAAALDAVIKSLPAAVRKPARLFFLAKAVPLRGSFLGIATNLRIWLEREDLDPADVADILAELCRPEWVARHTFDNQVLTDLAEMAVARIKRRKQQREQLLRRQAAEAGAAASAEIVRLADFFKSPKE